MCVCVCVCVCVCPLYRINGFHSVLNIFDLTLNYAISVIVLNTGIPFLP